MKARLLTEAGSLAHKKWSKREISLTYRNLEIKLMADTVAMEIDLRCAACLKSRLAAGNLLLGMEFENDILRILDGTAMNSTNTHDNRGGSEQQIVLSLTMSSPLSGPFVFGWLCSFSWGGGQGGGFIWKLAEESGASCVRPCLGSSA